MAWDPGCPWYGGRRIAIHQVQSRAAYSLDEQLLTNSDYKTENYDIDNQVNTGVPILSMRDAGAHNDLP